MKKVELIGVQKFWHYSPVYFLLIVPVLTIWRLFEYYVLETYDGVRSPEEMITSWPFILLAVLVYILQKRRLNFHKIDIAVVNGENINKALDKTKTQLNWVVDSNDGVLIRAHRGWNWSNSWGEQITILYKEEEVYINSICDPNAVFISLVSYGWNKKNVRTFITNLKQETA